MNIKISRQRFVALVALAVLLVFGGTSALAYFQDTWAGGVSGTITRNCLVKSAGNSKGGEAAICDDGTTITFTEPLSSTKQLKTTLNPADTTNTSASLLVNPAAAATNEPLLGVLLNGTTNFLVDAEGDVTILGGIALNTNKFTVAAASGNTAIAGTLAVTGAINGPFGATRVVGSTQAITAAMSGQLFAVNNASDAATVLTLPAASTAGLRYCFSADAVSGSNREVDVETPAGSDLIIGTTNPAGATGIATTAGASHGIKNTHATAVRGNGTCVQADGTNTWYMTSLSGTWAAY